MVFQQSGSPFPPRFTVFQQSGSRSATAPENKRARQPPRTSQFTTQTARQTDRQPATTVRHNSQPWCDRTTPPSCLQNIPKTEHNGPVSVQNRTCSKPNKTSNTFKIEQKTEHVQNRTPTKTPHTQTSVFEQPNDVQNQPCSGATRGEN